MVTCDPCSPSLIGTGASNWNLGLKNRSSCPARWCKLEWLIWHIFYHKMLSSFMCSKSVIHCCRNKWPFSFGLQSQNHSLPNICSPTVEKSHITVKSAGAHSAKQDIWKGTSAFTLEKNLTSAHIAITQVLNPLLLNNTWPNIQQMTNFVLQYDAKQIIQNWVSMTIHE